MARKERLNCLKFKERDAIDLASFQLSRFYSFIFKQSKNLIALEVRFLPLFRYFIKSFKIILRKNMKILIVLTSHDQLGETGKNRILARRTRCALLHFY